jgi:PadR family transcriptional regulator AphA
MQTELPELSLSQWAVLGLIVERRTHGWPVVRELGSGGDLGQVWTVSRGEVYRSLSLLEREQMIESWGEAPGENGPQRTIWRATSRGRTALARWLRTPASHVRDIRSEFLLKLAFLMRAGKPTNALIEQQIAALAPIMRAVATPGDDAGYDFVLAQWRRAQAEAVDGFLKSLINEQRVPAT